jgi:AraC family transcriptional regulator
MIRLATDLSYSQRIERVAIYIADHLDEPLSVERLAGVACFSPYHFHRIYRALTNETVSATLRRLRLHRAAGDLSRSGMPVSKVARRAGYGSAAAFSRAFVAAYGMPPAAYRARAAPPSPEQAAATEEIDMYEVRIKDFAPVRLAALDHKGEYQAIGTAFSRLAAWAKPRGLLANGARSFGVYFDDPESVPAAELRSIAGITVGDDFVGADDVRVYALPAMKVASVIHKGPYAELEKPYRWLYKEWLPKSGYDPANQPCFEEYLNDCRTLPPTEWLTEVSVPLAR